MLNRIVLVGRLVADPEEKFTNDGMAISKFRVAVDRNRKSQSGDKETDFFNVVCFRQSAEFANRYLRRGYLVAVDGRLQIDHYNDRDGNRQMWVEVQADTVQNLTPRDGGGGPGGGGGDEERDGGRNWQHSQDRGNRGRDDFAERGDAPRDAGNGRRQQFEPPAGEPRGSSRGAAPAGGSYEDDEDDPFLDE